MIYSPYSLLLLNRYYSPIQTYQTTSMASQQVTVKQVIIQGELIPPDESLSVGRLLVVKPNELILAQYDFTTSELKLFNALVSLINPTALYTKNDRVRGVSLTAEQIAWLTGINQKNVYKFIRSAAHKFHSRPVVILTESDNPEKPSWKNISLADTSEWDQNAGVFNFTFGNEIMNLLSGGLSQYTKYSLIKIHPLSKPASIRIYELASLLLNPKLRKPVDKKYTLAEIHDLLALSHIDHRNGKRVLTSSYENWSEFKRIILDPAVKEVSNKTDIEVSYTTIKVKRTVVKVKFFFRYIPAAEKAKDSTSDNVDQLKLRLGEFYHAEKINQLMKSYSIPDFKSALNYFDDLVAGGKVVKNKSAFLLHLLKYNIAVLPEVANPYSHLYRFGTVEYEFVNQHLMKNWFDLIDINRVEIQKFGLSATCLLDEFKEYRKLFDKKAVIFDHTTTDWF